MKVYKNKFVAKDIDKNIEIVVSATELFTTSRLLVGDFNNAEVLLKDVLSNLCTGNWWAPSPIIAIRSMELNECGLSPVGARELRELAFGAGGRKVIVWLGKELTNEEVIGKSKAHNNALR